MTRPPARRGRRRHGRAAAAIQLLGARLLHRLEPLEAERPVPPRARPRRLLARGTGPAAAGATSGRRARPPSPDSRRRNLEAQLGAPASTKARYCSASARIEIRVRSTFWSRASVSRTSIGPSKPSRSTSSASGRGRDRLAGLFLGVSSARGSVQRQDEPGDRLRISGIEQLDRRPEQARQRVAGSCHGLRRSGRPNRTASRISMP